MSLLTEMGNRIRIAREQLGLTQDELARRTGYTSRSSVNKIEDGKVDIPQSKIQLFANALNVTPSYIMGWENIDEELTLNFHEKQVIQAYRNKPEMQPAVDKLLGVDSEELVDDMIKTMGKIKIPTRKK